MNERTTHKFLQFLQQLCTERLLLQGQITHREKKRKTAREKRKNVCFPSSSPAAHHREKKFFFQKNFMGGGIYNKLNFIKQNYTDFEERLREFDSFVYVFTITSSSSGIDREKKIFFFQRNNNNNNNIQEGGIYNKFHIIISVCHNE